MTVCSTILNPVINDNFQEKECYITYITITQ